MSGIFTALTLSAFGLFLAWAGDNLAGPHVQPIDDGLVDMAETAQLVESEHHGLNPPAGGD